ncbi:tetratricopeptide repeat protein [Streptomyces olindensis]|uniref:tetratricopeptide repeat protein n=1 Tax=Streptomyces olindensis TaxID=358823 RepID=UPI003686C0A1
MTAPYYDLGEFTRGVTTSSGEAQLWFDRGMSWSYAFNFEEAARCFERARKHDPDLAIASWGFAYASGPNYNKAWRLFDAADFDATVEAVTGALRRADEAAPRATPVEQALITAIAARFPAGPGTVDVDQLNLAYAEAMRTVYEAFPDDLDVATLFADALLCVSPRALWDVESGEPTGYGTADARRVLERALSQPGGERHAGLNHLYVHLMEMSPHPELALPAAERLRHFAPDAGHLAHMATHIDNACGDYRRSVDSNTDAIAADDRYFAREEGVHFYHLYRAHNLYVKVYAAMLGGHSHEAEDAARRLVDYLTEDLLRVTSPPMADWVESHVSALPHVLIRFGRWEEIVDLELPKDRDLYCVTTAMILYAKGVAYAALGRTAEAEEARSAFAAAAAAVPDSRMSLPNKEVDVLKVAAAMLDGELEYRKGNFDEAFAKLRLAIELEDALQYADPRSWLQPVRHAYGALLLERGHVAEAERVYRSDLGMDGKLPRTRIHPNNVWSLHGLHECLTRLGRHEEAAMIAVQRDIAVAAADVTIQASCYCRLETYDDGAADSHSAGGAPAPVAADCCSEHETR